MRTGEESWPAQGLVQLRVQLTRADPAHVAARGGAGCQGGEVAPRRTSSTSRSALRRTSSSWSGLSTARKISATSRLADVGLDALHHGVDLLVADHHLLADAALHHRCQDSSARTCSRGTFWVFSKASSCGRPMRFCSAMRLVDLLDGSRRRDASWS
uniref:hypothetical protein n=1 Tax=Azospirillum argentinense TaxID=2970906 RepID=UPI00200020D0|nr:hypothetical protein [Azospirillum argentinense]